MTRSLSQPTVSRTGVRDEDLPPADDPFFYGWREVLQRVNGTEENYEYSRQTRYEQEKNKDARKEQRQ